ncbi:SRPBCC family protein [Corallibacter sp.]|uniref:SRPBCC family protein n=1 Tax=Corallibacter sp. TaxID=2038084 RepID=UPI003A90E0AB
MPLIKIETHINADQKLCFDLARDISIHEQSLKRASLKAVSGKTSGLLELNEWVSWEEKHFGIVQHLTLKISEFEKPILFTEEMEMGVFKRFKNEFYFSTLKEKTVLVNVLDFELPFGFLGKVLNKLFFKNYVKKLLIDRILFLKMAIENCSEN